jgi:phosphoketolase
MNGPLSPELLRKMNAYWRAANYLSVGQMYLYDNPLLKEPLKREHVSPPKRPARSTRAASWAIRCRMPTARPSTIQT